MDTEAWGIMIGLATVLAIGGGAWMTKIAIQLSTIVVKLDQLLERTNKQDVRIDAIEQRLTDLETVSDHTT